MTLVNVSLFQSLLPLNALTIRFMSFLTLEENPSRLDLYQDTANLSISMKWS